MYYGAHFTTAAATGGILTAGADLAGIINPHPAAYAGYLLVAGGFGLANDADSDESVFTTSGGYASRALAEGLQGLSRATFRATRKRCDTGNGEHRFLIHNPWFHLLVGVLTFLGCWAVPSFGTLDLASLAEGWLPATQIPLPGIGWCIMVAVLAPALRALAMELHHGQNVRVRRLSKRHYGKTLNRASRVAYWFMTGLRTRRWSMFWALFLGLVLEISAGPALFGPWFGVMAFVGMVVHSGGDSVTHWGIPWKWPFAHRCDRHRARYLAESCSWRVRAPWHHCPACDRARRNYPRCARWDRNNWLPKGLTFSAGNKEIENKISMVCLLLSACTLVLGILV